MKWREFSSLLSGLSDKSALARTVAIRLEDDPDILKNFTSAQHRIRNEWRTRKAETATEAEKQNAIDQIKQMFINMCK